MKAISFLFAIALVLIPSPILGKGCRRLCSEKESEPCVPYPFGFSPECRIQLKLSSSRGKPLIGRFPVEKITPRAITIRLESHCSLAVSSVSPVFSENYALSSTNTLLLHNCTSSYNPNSCSSPNLLSHLGAPLCNHSDLTCFPEPQPHTPNVLSYQSLISTSCNSLFSSFSRSPDGSITFRKANLSWWLNGRCPSPECSSNSHCVTIKLPDKQSGFVCECDSGFSGDGFKSGDGCRKHSDRNLRVGEILIGGSIGALLTAIVSAVIFCLLRRRTPTPSSRLVGNFAVPLFQYKEIEKATNSFSEMLTLGTGAYGTVYAGKMNNGDLVAVKRIRRRDSESIDQVTNEINLLSSVNHPNLVRLLGCCIDRGEHILVYEFMPNGTLCQHLQKERGNGLPWATRVAIATETARAIAYLHSVDPPIFHRDVKSSNILLDDNFNSKVADFGLSRVGTTDEATLISTAPQGTPGYVDPQYHQYFHLSDKSDVYSFGVVLAEILTGLKAVDFSRPVGDVNLAALAVEKIGRGCVGEILDSCLDVTRDTWTMSSVHRVAELAFRCLASHGDMRPAMSEVADELETIRISAHVTSGAYVASSGSSIGSSERGRVMRRVDNLQPLDDGRDSSHVFRRDYWHSERNPPRNVINASCSNSVR